MHKVNIHEAKTKLSKLIQEVLDGTEVIIAKNNKPIVKIIKIEEGNTERKIGLAKNNIQISSDFLDSTSATEDY